MNYVTTNIRIPEEDYMWLKIEAAKKRVSIAHLIREKVSRKVKKQANHPQKLLNAFSKVAKANAKKLKGQSLSKLVIEMRYEQ